MKKIFIYIMVFMLAALPLFGLHLVTAQSPELVLNGNFELPVVTDAEDWDIFTSAQVPGWTAQWRPTVPANFGGEARPVEANLELHRGVNGWLAFSGEQYAELDTDWDGPGAPLLDEPASVRIFQDLITEAGREYRLQFAFSPRPGTPLAENQLYVEWDGAQVALLSESGIGNANTDWLQYEYVLTATGSTTRLAFEDRGTANSLGTFLDDVSVRQVEEDTECCESNDVVVGDNEAEVINDIKVRARTGGNWAGGSYGGDGGDAGDISGDEVEDSMTGNGGNGGEGNIGGTIQTGEANAEVTISNDVNLNDVEIDRCACEEGDTDELCNAKCGDTLTFSRN